MSDHTSTTGFVAPDPDYLAGLFPGYEIVRFIACGGMGAVYEAVQRSLDRGVAIKILPSEFTADETFRTNFQSEAKAMARLNHPNLISVYDFGEIDGMLYIIMEYVSGQSLHHVTNGHPVEPGDAARLVCGIAHGLAHAHDNGIIHRDIKPANILLDHNNEPKIGDFGLARPLEIQIQEGEDIFGTPGYTAPEVVEHPQSIDHRADIFSLGVLLHELLTGQLPEDDPRSASAICQCDPRFDAVIRKATQPSPDGRYAHADEIAREIEKISTTAGPRALQTAPPKPRYPGTRRSTSYQALPKPRRSKAPMIVMLLAAIGVTGFLYHQKSREIASDANAANPSDPPEATTPEPVTPPPDTGQPDPEEPEIVVAPTESVDGVEHWRDATSSWEPSGEILKFTVESGDIHGADDEGVFKQETWSGDGYFTLCIDSLTGGHPADAKAGLMIRENLNEGARNIFLARNSGGETVVQIRTQESCETIGISRTRGSHSHLGIQRIGDRLTAVASTDGKSWIDLGTFQIPNLASTLHIGFAAAAASNHTGLPLTGAFHEPVLQAVDDDLLVDGAPQPLVNINELFDRARSVMRERARPIIANYNQEHQANIESYIQQSEAWIDELTGWEREQFINDYQDVLRAVKANGHIAYTAPQNLQGLDGYIEFHQKHLERQQEIERVHLREMAELSEIYLNGIAIQITRSQADNDVGTVMALTAEQERVMTFPYYFRGLMERFW